MSRKGVFPALQADDAFTPVPSDTVNIADDENNPQAYAFCFLHNPSTTDAVAVRVLPAAAADDDNLAVDISIPACGTHPLAVKRIFATDPSVAEGDLTALVSGQR
jgi:hypothetical protein